MAMFREVLRRVALLAATLSSGGAEGIPGKLAAIPESALSSALEDSASDEQWRSADRLKLLELLTYDPRPAVRERTKRELAALLPELGPAQWIRLASDWAFSENEQQRIAIARALGGRGAFTLGEAGILDHLGRDPSPAVRATLRAALASRGARKA